MTTEVSTGETIGNGAAALPRSSTLAPYPRSWVNVVIDWVERLPGPSWLAYALALAPAFLLVSLTDWLSGTAPGGLAFDHFEWAAALVGSIALINYLDGVARTSLHDFAGTLDLAPAALARLEFELTVIPARPALLILILAAARTAEGFALEPASESIVGWTPLPLAIRAPIETVTTALLLTLLYHTLRQLRLVGRIHAIPARVILFRPAPLYAFSRLTSRTAIGLIPLVIPFGSGILQAESTLEFATTYSIAGLILGIAVLAFTVPLVGMHNRMSAEKKRLQGEVGGRVEALIDELHGAVDRHDLSLADGQNKQLGSLIAERDLVTRLSTWPWQAGTAGAVASAIILPIVIALVTRLLGRIV